MSLLTILSIIRWARRQKPVHGAVAKNVLTALATYADKRGTCYPSQDELAAATGYGERAVRLALTRLEADGYLTRTPRSRRDGSRDTDLITLQLDRPENADHRNPMPVAEPPSTGIPQQPHRNLTTDQPESDSAPTTFEGAREESRKGSDPDGSAPPCGASPGFRQDLFERGTRILVRLTGRVERGCRAVIGTWLSLMADDAAAVMRAIDEAEAAEPAEAIAWIEARLRHGRKAAGTAPTVTPAAAAVVAERQAQAEAMVARGQWPVGGRVFVAADSPAGAAWDAYYRARGVVPRWGDLGRTGRGWHMPSELPPTSPPALAA